MVMGREQLRPGAITDEQWQQWNEYRKNGGLLELYEWVDSGMPSVVSEKAAAAWLERLGAYLMSQTESGFISESERDVIWDDMVGRLTGQGKYAGQRHTILDLPSSVLSDVERYWTGLPKAEQKRIEDVAKELQTRAEVTARQAQELPLGVRGTSEQQVQAAYGAIRNLKLQMAAAPDYLQTQMGQQITQLEQAIEQIKGGIRGQARARTEEEMYPPNWQSELGPGKIAQDFAEKYGMSPEAAQQTGLRYFQHPESEEFSNLTKEESRSLAWVGMEAAGSQRPLPAAPPHEPAGFEELGVTAAPWKSWFERRYPQIVSKFKEKPPIERTAGSWSEFLERERKRIREEFTKQSAYQRGERPSAFQPRLKTVAF